MTMQEQAQAWLPILEAMANGKTVQVFNGEWKDKVLPDLISGIEYRIKPETIIVNGFEIEAPMSEPIDDETPIYIPSLVDDCMCLSVPWFSDPQRLALLERGVCHKTRAAAIAHAKAMIGVDPNA